MSALDGIHILDLTWQGPGPFCTFILGDMGAEIIKIGAPAAAGARQTSIKKGGERELAYEAIHRNKKSLQLNLKSDEGRNVFYKLAKNTDVIVEGFRPGVAKRLNIDYPTMSKINPGIIYCSITSYGQDGPYSNLSGHDLQCISIAGVLDLIGESDGPPIVPLNLIADYGGGGKDAAIGILSALIARGRTGRGQFVDISLTDSSLSLITEVLSTPYFMDGVVPKRGEHDLGGAYPYYSVYKTKDGKYITLGCVEPWLWAKLCKEIGKEEFIPFDWLRERTSKEDDDKQAKEIFASLRKVFLSKTRDEWFETLGSKDVPIAKVCSLDDTFKDPQILHRQMVIEVEHPTEGKVKQMGISVKLSDTPGTVRRTAPTDGEHTDEILAGLGYSSEKIKELHEAGIV